MFVFLGRVPGLSSCDDSRTMPTHHYVNVFSVANRSAILGLMLMLMLVLLAACGGGGGGETQSTSGASNGASVVLESIAVTPTNPTLVFGQTLQLLVTGTYSDGTTRDISATAIWSSTAPSVTELSTSGLVSSAGIGTSQVFATSGTFQASTTVVVTAGTATESILHTFGPGETDGLAPDYLIQASDGNFYGTTLSGGNSCSGGSVGCGTFFEITPDGVETVLYLFGASPSDGWDPGGLIQASDGNFYGTSAEGGAYGAGTVFKLTPAGVETVLYSFGASPSDGAAPSGPLIQASDGDFYGTTASGGVNYCATIPGSSNNCGTAFKITPAGLETVVHSFGTSVSDGVEPLGSLIQASDGNFYGTTSGGGANTCSIPGEIIPGQTNNCGTVFKITAVGVETVLYSFGVSPSDGDAPLGPLIQASDGNFYGTTASGGGLPCLGANGCGGTVFGITPSGTESILYRFVSGPADQGSPAQFLIQASDGNFYGTTVDGGPYETQAGTAFQITPDGVETILYSFGASDSDGIRPVFVMQARDGNLYGVTDNGGGDRVVGGVTVQGGGTVFKLVP
jgi:uncharacterized repeat protein (TIGR03803 family)